jgi:hypothetical protein
VSRLYVDSRIPRRCAVTNESSEIPGQMPLPFEPGSLKAGDIIQLRATGTMKTPAEKIRDLLGVQGASGNWDYDPYMLGLYNGLELALSILEGERQPQFLSKPEGGWRQDVAMPTRSLTADEESLGRVLIANPGMTASDVKPDWSTAESQRDTAV